VASRGSNLQPLLNTKIYESEQRETQDFNHFNPDAAKAHLEWTQSLENGLVFVQGGAR